MQLCTTESVMIILCCASGYLPWSAYGGVGLHIHPTRHLNHAMEELQKVYGSSSKIDMKAFVQFL